MATFITGSGIKGAAELEARLMALGTEVASKIVQAADRQAAKVVQQAVIAAAPDGPTAEGASTGKGRTHSKIKNHVKIKRGRSQNPNAATVLVHTGEAFQALFVERGTIHMAPRPFFGPAFAASKDAALAKMAEALEKGIARTATTGTSGMSPDGGVQVDS